MKIPTSKGEHSRKCIELSLKQKERIMPHRLCTHSPVLYHEVFDRVDILQVYISIYTEEILAIFLYTLLTKIYNKPNITELAFIHIGI